MPRCSIRTPSIRSPSMRTNAGAVLKVKPLDLPEAAAARQSPAGPTTWSSDSSISPTRSTKSPGGRSRRWSCSSRCCCGKANELVAADKLDEAYDYFRFLEENYPNMAGLAAAERRIPLQAGQGVLRHAAVPQCPGGAARVAPPQSAAPKTRHRHGRHDGEAGRAICRRRRLSFRPRLLRELAACYPQHPLVEKWETRLKGEAAALLADARAAEQSGDLRKAAAAIRRVIRHLAGAGGRPRIGRGQFTANIPASSSASARRRPPGRRRVRQRRDELLTDWAARRSARLVCRTLAEFAGAGPSGGTYRCPVGEIKLAETAGGSPCSCTPISAGRPEKPTSPATTFAPAAGHGRSGRSGLSPRLGQALRRRGGPATCIRSTSTCGKPTSGPRHCCRRCCCPTPRPARRRPSDRRWTARTSAGRMPATPRPPTCSTPAISPALRPNRRKSSNGGLPTRTAAAAALRRGEIQVLDRVSPWQVEVARGRRRTWPCNPTPCRGFIAWCPTPAGRWWPTGRSAAPWPMGSIARPSWTNCCAAAAAPAARSSTVLSRRASPAKDALGYASDPETKPWPYDPRLAVVLAESGRRELAAGTANCCRPRRARAPGAGLPAQRNRADRLRGHPPAACRDRRRRSS